MVELQNIGVEEVVCGCAQLPVGEAAGRGGHRTPPSLGWVSAGHM